LHVLATPPAFRLSQDQTLQLNFVARVTPHAGRYARTDSFATRVYPRNEFVQTRMSKTLTRACYCPRCRLGQAGQSRLTNVASDVAKREQGSNIFLAAPGATPELSKLIKEDHFCVHRKDA
jgi:hypothetical protein